MRSLTNLIVSLPRDVTVASCRAEISAATWSPDTNSVDHCR